MLRYLFVAALLATSTLAIPAAAAAEPARAAAPALRSVYVELEGTAAPSARSVTVRLVLGSALSDELQLNADDRRHLQQRVTPPGATMLDALNTMARHGWTLVSTETAAVRGNTVQRWLLTKRVAHPAEALDGLL